MLCPTHATVFRKNMINTFVPWKTVHSRANYRRVQLFQKHECTASFISRRPPFGSWITHRWMIMPPTSLFWSLKSTHSSLLLTDSCSIFLFSFSFLNTDFFTIFVCSVSWFFQCISRGKDLGVKIWMQKIGLGLWHYYSSFRCWKHLWIMASPLKIYCYSALVVAKSIVEWAYNVGRWHCDLVGTTL